MPDLAFTAHARDELANLSEAAFGRVLNSLDLLRTSPFLGKVYDPSYDAGFPPFECRVLFVSSTTKAVYYYLDSKSDKVIVFEIGDVRADPMTRFVGIRLSDLEQ